MIYCAHRAQTEANGLWLLLADCGVAIGRIARVKPTPYTLACARASTSALASVRKLICHSKQMPITALKQTTTQNILSINARGILNA